MFGRRTGGRAGSRALRRARALPAILLSGALMLVWSGPPAAAAPTGQHRGPVVEAGTGHVPTGPSVTSADELPDTVPAATVSGKLGYPQPSSAGTVVDPLDRSLLDTGVRAADRPAGDSAEAPTDPQRGPPATRQ